MQPIQTYISLFIYLPCGPADRRMIQATGLSQPPVLSFKKTQ